MRSRLRRSDDRGETLIEMICAIAILGVCVVGIGTGIALSVRVSSLHRAQATAQAFLHNYAETLQASYTQCSGATPPNYAGSLAYPSDFNQPTASVKFWSASTASFSSATCPATDPGLQQVSLQLTSTDGLVTESLLVVIRSTP